MYLVKTPSFIKRLYKSLTWDIPSAHDVFLSFDDGPDPIVTPWVLDLLKSHNAKASFFLIGENAIKYPELVDRIRQEGHTVGNHSYQHLSGWKTKNTVYLDDVNRCHKVLGSKYFRPPYGRLKPAQKKMLVEKYSIVMWDVMSGDFDTNISKEQCLQNVLDSYRPGSIIVFHDTQACFAKLEYALPLLLEDISTKQLHGKQIIT